MIGNLSYWEQNTWLSDIDVAIVGSGIVGLCCAIRLKERFPERKIVVFERGLLPSGASTKNAGFACFGSASELLDDLERHSPDEVLELVKTRVSGLRKLRKLLGDTQIDFQQHGGYEVFLRSDTGLFEQCISGLGMLNELLQGTFEPNEAILSENAVFSIKNDPFSFKNTKKQLIFNQYEAQIDTGKMMDGLLRLAQKMGVFILNSTKITSILAKNGQISMVLNENQEILVKAVCIATNGFAKQLLQADVEPARAQVLVTKPIKDLPLKGTFHLDKGYYYFRNIHNRLLFGGGRNLDFKAERTTKMEQTALVMQRLEALIRDTILPGYEVEIEQRWSGIMGVGTKKRAIVKEVQPGVFCGVRLGGMGVAIGSHVGSELADLVQL